MLHLFAVTGELWNGELEMLHFVRTQEVRTRTRSQELTDQKEREREFGQKKMKDQF